MEISIKDWTNTSENKAIKLITLTNTNNNSIVLTNYGATWVSAIVPDKKGNKADIILGFPTIDGYLYDTCYIGSTIGRYANRIEQAQFKINNNTYKISANVAPHSLHGGEVGFNKKIWDYKVIENGVIFSLTSPDGDQGYPGNLNVKVTYTWSNDNELDIIFRARTDKTTQINLTNHAYFNLTGNDSDINNHELTIYSNYYLPMKEGSIVTGEMHSVKNTPFDFTTAKIIGRDIDCDDPQLILANGYDHTFVLKQKNNNKLIIAAKVYEPSTGRLLEVYTTYPSIHLYTGNFLESIKEGKNNKQYKKREALCLEAQYLPNTPNQPNFPNSALQPEKTYNQTIKFKFLTK